MQQKYFVIYTREDQVVKSFIGNEQVTFLLKQGVVKNIVRLATNQIAELKEERLVWQDILEEAI